MKEPNNPNYYEWDKFKLVERIEDLEIERRSWRNSCIASTLIAFIFLGFIVGSYITASA